MGRQLLCKRQRSMVKNKADLLKTGEAGIWKGENMKLSSAKRILAGGLCGIMLVSAVPPAEVLAASDISSVVESNLNIKESQIRQQLTGDLILPDTVEGLDGASIQYSVAEEDAPYVKVEGNTLKITRPYAGQGNYDFTLTATVAANDASCVKEFPMTIREGDKDDSYAGYLYVCFANKGGSDVQQIHFFLSEDGLNWTALNGCNPAFLAGSDYTDRVYKTDNVNYAVAEETNIEETTAGDASVLFPFEGEDQGIRDPYMLRGAKADGSDSDKVWILATDLNTMAPQYGGNWGTMSHDGSTSLFIYETEDFVNWTRRWVDVGSEIEAGAAWAPEAIYNPEKDNYLIYWSCRVATDGYSRNRIYCNETDDFVTFGPTKMYEQEAFYKNWGKLVNANDGYGNIDTSQLWVADTETGDPYGTVYRVVKDETDNHIELMSADSVLDPNVDYDSSDPGRITPYEKDGTLFTTLEELNGAGYNDYQRADVVWNWFRNESAGNHFQKIDQAGMEKYSGAYEGATMFKFFDRDEWCVMIDYYGKNSVRYEPYVTYDLSQPDSIRKVSDGYGRTGGDVGCHGGMIPVTLEEYNTLLDTYNSDAGVDNYHALSYISVDKRELEEVLGQLDEAIRDTEHYTAAKIQKMKNWKSLGESYAEDSTVSFEKISQVVTNAKNLMGEVKPEKLNTWSYEDGNWYYYNEAGEKAKGWLKLLDTWYYLKDDGVMATGWLKLGNTWYYLKGNGAMATGWQLIENTWYYLKDSGAMATGWLRLGNTWYYLKDSGAMATGWLKLGNTWYYLKDSGAMATGWLKLGNTWYYLKDSGAMASSQWIGKYYVNASGAWTKTR